MAKLTPELRELVIDRVAKGARYEDVIAWLEREHSVTVTKQAVSKLVQKHRSGQADQAKTIARTHLGARLAKDLNEFEGHMGRLSKLLKRASSDASSSLTSAAVDRVTKLASVYQKFSDQRQRAAGLEQPDEKASDLATLLARI